MFLDLFRVAGTSHSLPFLDLASRVLFMALCAVMVFILGYKIRRLLGVGLLLIYGIFVYMLNYGMLR
jgi:hypothetical protein